MKGTAGNWYVAKVKGDDLCPFYVCYDVEDEEDGIVGPHVAKVASTCDSDKTAAIDADRIAAVPEMEAVLRRLLAWEGYMGGWEHPAWQEARDLLRRTQQDEENFNAQ